MVIYYDVVIIGAGPAGLSTAIAVAKNKLKCLIIDKNQEIGFPVRTSGASWLPDMIELGIPKECLNPIKAVTIIGPHEKASITFDKPIVCILDVTKVYQYLASKAKYYGADLLLESSVKNVLMEQGIVRGVEIVNNNNNLIRIRSKVVVDASGYSATLVRKLGFLTHWSRTGVGFQYNIESSNVNYHEAVLFLGERFAPSGYGWFFPWARNRARIGIGVIKPDSNAIPAFLANKLMRTIYASSLIGDITIINKEAGAFPCSGPLEKTVTNSFLAVGDAAGLGSPLHGEGIRYAIKFGTIAGDVISRAIKLNDVSEKSLFSFEKTWRAAEGRNFKIALAIQKRISKYSDAQWDRSIKYLREIAEKDIELVVQMFKTNFSYRNIWRVFKYSPLKAIKTLLSNL
jgi:digeranylgeranylglycerophospholipid reductase